MPFVNERLTTEQREEFARRGVKNPIPMMENVLHPTKWTIDKERDMYLIDAGIFREYWTDHYFVFINNDQVISFSATKKTLSDISVVGHLADIYKNNDLNLLAELSPIMLIEENLSNINEAFETFKILGSVDENPNDKSLKVKFELWGGNNDFV